MKGYLTHRCGECTLVRCYGPDQTCDECRQHAQEAFDMVQRNRPVDSSTYAPYDWFRHAP